VAEGRQYLFDRPDGQRPIARVLGVAQRDPTTTLPE
jgi:hypothetical protein